jgi:hypothetical protein
MSLTDKEHNHVAICLQNIADALIAKDAEIERLRVEVEELRRAISSADLWDAEQEIKRRRAQEGK